MLYIAPGMAQEEGEVLLTTPEAVRAEIEDDLHLPRRSYPALRVPWLLLMVEATGLCRCFGRRKVRRRTYQVLVVVLTFLCYMTYHLTRKTISSVKSILDPNNCPGVSNLTNSSLALNTSLLGEDLGLSSKSNSTRWIEICLPGWPPFNGPEGETELGVLDYTFLFAYAICMFFSGIIAERTPLRYFLVVGMLGSMAMNVLFGIAYWANIHTLAFFVVVQLLGGALQSTGWPGVVAVMSNWFGKGNRGFIMGLWNTHTSIGNILGTVIPAYFAEYGWGWAFVSTGAIMFLITIALFLLLPSEPQVVGLAPPKTDQTAQAGSVAEGDKHAIGFFRALLIPGVIEYSLALFFSKLVAYTFLFWLPFYIDNQAKFTVTPFDSAWISTFFDFGGIFGSVFIGLLSDLLKVRAIPTTAFLLLSVPVLFVYRSYGGASEGAAIGLVWLTGFFVNAPYSIITTAISADLGTHGSLKGNAKATATVTAIIDGTGSLGAAIGPLLTGVISEHTSGGRGWQNVFYLLMGSCFLAAVFTLRLVYSEIKKFIKWAVPKCRGYSALSERTRLNNNTGSFNAASVNPASKAGL